MRKNVGSPGMTARNYGGLLLVGVVMKDVSLTGSRRPSTIRRTIETLEGSTEGAGMSRETEMPLQRLVSRKRSSYWWPRIFLVIMTVNLIWEITKRNLSAGLVGSWPWKLTLLDVATSATLASAVLALLLARSQLARTNRPVISYSSFSDESFFIRKAERVIHVRNAGAGHAIVCLVKYRFRMAGPRSGVAEGPAGEWMDWQDVVDRLEERGLTNWRHYVLPRIGSGSALPLTGAAGAGLEMVAFTRQAMLVLAELDILLRIEDTLGDQHERVLVCMSERHRKEVIERRQRRRLPFLR